MKTLNLEKLMGKFPELETVVLDGKTDYTAVARILQGAPNEFVWGVINALKANQAFNTEEFYD